MATTKKSKVTPSKKPRVKTKTKKVSVLHTLADKVTALITFSDLYSRSNRTFPVGSLVVLNSYSFMLNRNDNTYRLAIVVGTPKLFSKYDNYQIAFFSETGKCILSDVDKSEIICHFEEAPAEFTFE